MGSSEKLEIKSLLSSGYGIEDECWTVYGSFYVVRVGRLRNNWRRVPADGLKGLIDSYVHAHGTSSHTSGRRGRETAQLKAILHFVSGTMNELGTHKDSSRHAVLARRRKTLRRSLS